MSRRISTVSFLRTQAEQAGGLRSSRGQAFHRAAAHFIKMDEALQAAEARILSAETDWPELAQNAYAQASSIWAVEGRAAPAWADLTDDARETWVLITRAAHGAPVWERPGED